MSNIQMVNNIPFKPRKVTKVTLTPHRTLMSQDTKLRLLQATLEESTVIKSILDFFTPIPLRR